MLIILACLSPLLPACGTAAPSAPVAKAKTVASPVPATPPPLTISLGISPASPAQGDTIDLHFSFSQPTSSFTVLVDNQAKTAYPVSGGYRVLWGTDPSSPTGLRQVEVTATGLTGQKADQTAAYNLQPTSFPERIITLPPSKTTLMAPATEAKEANLADAALAPRTPSQLWSGPFTLPLGNAPIDSPYGYWGVYNGVRQWSHQGVDFTAPAGTPVGACANGIVTLAYDLPMGGNTVIINHGQGVISEYLHLATITVQQGQTVTAGQEVGTVGGTGLATGPGLHWGVYVNGIFVNPLDWAASPPT